mgnify:CR=1 FL=1
MRVPAQHLPILVAGDQRDLFDRESGLEQAACALMAQIVEMKVLHADLHTGAPEGGSDRPRVEGKYPAPCVPEFLGLFGDQRPGVEPRGGEERDPLVVSGLVARVFSVAGTLALLGSSLDKFAVEIRSLQRTEIREVEERIAVSALSSHQSFQTSGLMTGTRS